MKKYLLIILSIMLLVSALVFFNFTEKTEPAEETSQKILGYCPTMHEEAISLSKGNNYELVELGSASEVLFDLKNNQIDKAIIGRKAEKTEISSNTKETILKSGYTLVSNKRGFIDYLELPSIEIYTYLSNEIASGLISASSKIIYVNKNEIIKQIDEGKTALISWEDWGDDFELIVVTHGNEKVKDFRGVFLYEN